MTRARHSRPRRRAFSVRARLRRRRLGRELVAMARTDQEARRDWRDDPEQAERVERLDRHHTERLRELIDRFGWPGPEVAGVAGSQAAWLLVQHADHDPEFQRRCLGLLEDAVARDEAEPRQVAFLTDRVRIHEGQLQRFGTQLRLEEGRLRPIPIEDPDGVDERRRSAGLGPLDDYLRDTERSYGLLPSD
ncbi:MAG: hypothetical protein M3Q23_02160 [Actinomycetota bacterium]|nr:hypothetical protein [Actinomycetota bacterium]